MDASGTTTATIIVEWSFSPQVNLPVGCLPSINVSATFVATPQTVQTSSGGEPVCWGYPSFEGPKIEQLL